MYSTSSMQLDMMLQLVKVTATKAGLEKLPAGVNLSGLGMPMGSNPLGFAIPNPCPRI
jgi:hypothetical protein